MAEVADTDLLPCVGRSWLTLVVGKAVLDQQVAVVVQHPVVHVVGDALGFGAEDEQIVGTG